VTSFARRGSRLVFDVRVIPRSSANALLMRDGQLVVRVTAAPAEGKANEAVLRAVARALDVAPSDVLLLRGATTRTKTLSVPASAEAALRRMLK
jgi:uncharacterized protein YggU (UPF0235/DUF167 family)